MENISQKTLEQFIRDLGDLRDSEWTEPQPEIAGEGKEEVIGDMTDFQKLCYTAAVKLRLEISNRVSKAVSIKLQNSLTAGINPGIQEIDISESIGLLKNKHDLVDTIMWMDLNLQFPDFPYSQRVGIRKGFKVVKIIEKK